jgi:hypothetical protein
LLTRLRKHGNVLTLSRGSYEDQNLRLLILFIGPLGVLQMLAGYGGGSGAGRRSHGSRSLQWLTGPTILENMATNEQVRSSNFRGPDDGLDPQLNLVR